MKRKHWIISWTKSMNSDENNINDNYIDMFK